MTAVLQAAASFRLVTRFVRRVFPLVEEELAAWRQAAGRAAPELAVQALASIRDKRFHCLGGSVYSLYPDVNPHSCVRLVVALQTISDYLDNLCDRTGVTDEAAFRQLHLDMTDALDPDGGHHDYYANYPLAGDGGYLAALVAACRAQATALPSYPVVKGRILHLAALYSELQTYKHLDPLIREDKLARWGEAHLAAYPGLSLWEFAAASGSTLGIFSLCALAARPSLTEEDAATVYAAYFPWICGLHILLDYLIDLGEDRLQGDLNFVAYYSSPAEVLERLAFFRDQALAAGSRLPEAGFAMTVVQGLLAMYLSDPKTEAPLEKKVKTALLATSGGYTRLLHALCRLLRRRGVL